MFTKVVNLVIPSALFIIPLFFWTLTLNFFTSPQELLSILLVFLLTISYGLNIVQHKSLVLPQSTLVLPLFGVIFAVVLNLVFIGEGRPEALAGKGTFLLLLPLLSLLLLSHSFRPRLVHSVTSAIIGLSATLALHSLLQLTYLHSAPFLPTYMQTRNFTPTGSFLTTLILLFVGSSLIPTTLKHTSTRLRPLYYGILTLTTIASVAIISLMLPGSPLALNLIPYRETWSITLDALKPLRSLFLGVGISNFPSLYTAVKPLSLNLGNLWNILPQTGTSEILTLLATTGLAGFLAFCSLMIHGFRLASQNSRSLLPTFILVCLTLVLTPTSLPLYLLFFALLPLLDTKPSLTISLSSRFSLILGTSLVIIPLLFTVYSLRPHVADYYLRQAQLAFANNDGKAVYYAHQSAIRWYPQLTLSHISYAETNLRLASAISQKQDLTEADRSTISTLVQQAISEGKTAVGLRPNYSLTWVTLAQIYRNLINVATGSDRFAIDYYARAVELDAGNPALRVEYGGLFYQLGSSAEQETDKLSYYNRAASEFQTAVRLRPTYVNAYYNLSKVLETGKDYPNSYLAMQKVVANLDPTGPEYATALSELETLKTKLPPASPTPTPTPPTKSSELTEPSPLPSPLSGGPIDLPVPN